MNTHTSHFDFVFAYQESYDCKLVTSKHYILNHLLRGGNTILYVNRPLNLISWLRYHISNALFSSACLPSGLTIIQPVSLFPPIRNLFTDSAFFVKLEALLVAIYIAIVLGHTSISCSYFLLYLPTAIELCILFFLRPVKILFHKIDDFSAFPRSPRILKYYSKLADQLVSDIIVPSFRESYTPHDHRIPLYLPHCCNYTRQSFPATAEPPFRRPYLFYYGQTSKLSTPLILHVLQSIDTDFVVLGPPLNIVHPKLHQLGLQTHKIALNFLYYSQVLWCPFVVNTLTKAMSPIKFVEAASFGIPIVFSDISYVDPDLETFLYPAQSAHDHIQCLSSVLSMNTTTHPTSFSRSWDVTLEKFFSSLFARDEIL